MVEGQKGGKGDLACSPTFSPNSETGSVLKGIGTVFTNVRPTVTGGLSLDGAEGTGLGQDQHSMHSSMATTLSRDKIRDSRDC